MFAAFCPHPKCGKHEKPNRTAALPLSERPSERGVKPNDDSEAERCRHHKRSPPKRAVHYQLQCRQLNLKCCKKERFRQLVENKPRVIRRYGCRFFWANLCRFLILLKLRFSFRFKKQKIKGGKKRKGNSFRGQSTANGGGDFDVFASCLWQAAASAP